MENKKNVIVKYFLIGAVIFSIFFPVIFVFAQGMDDPVSMNNPLCWKKDACEEKRKELLGTNAGTYGGGWIQETPCTGEWGKCLPIGITKSQISFGGVTTFSDAGSFIKTVYNYSLIMLSILATVMIIIAGAQWISSGGNGEVIKQSQKRISGAVIGIFIAFMSYNILQSINPATINLRLPQVWLVAPIEEKGTVVETGEYCDPAGGETKIACEKDGKHVCYTIGYDKNREGPCAKVAFAVSVSSLAFVGGAAGVGTELSAQLGNGASKVLSSGGNAISKFITKIPAKELANFSKSEIVKKSLLNLGTKTFSLTTLKWGTIAYAAGAGCGELATQSADTVTCGKIIVNTAGGIVEYTMEEFGNFFANHNGICLEKSEALSNGAMCKVGASQCADGKCVKMKGVSAVFKCWADTEIGFCSDGKNGSQCFNKADCQTGLKCVEDAYVPLCSDGKAGSPCGEPEDCQTNICSKDRCVGGTKKEGDWCTDTAECPAGSCWARRGCGALVILNPGDCGTKQCQVYDPEGDKMWSQNTGICVDAKSNSTNLTVFKNSIKSYGWVTAANDNPCGDY